jgi:DNA polymerase-3 subunit gamma/tau
MSVKQHYQVLARKWRPKTFAELIGQEPVVQALTNSFAQQRLHHAYLFTGTRGVGKTTIARIIAKCFNCETGITATPCEKCETCIAINQGHFIDMIEVDAASRTKVEDTRELLDNVQYAPTQGRFKIYLIDEVHMLSGHSFNALLKTLEEPPEHVKFLLATTDPQKLPVTVLSRCLQFHLKNISAEVIVKHLKHILKEEKIACEDDALLPLAEAADGSMRDALSLLDQLIALSNANITLKSTLELLGQTNKTDLYPLLDALISNNGVELLNQIESLGLQGYSFGQVLSDFANLLHHITVAQVVPSSTSDEKIKAYAREIKKEDIQLFYQIAIIGRRDFAHAPSPRSGFEMVMLRMLAFVLNPPPLSHSPPSHSVLRRDEVLQRDKPANSAPQRDEPKKTDWTDILPELKLTGMSAGLAQHCAMKSFENDHLTLEVDSKYAAMANEKQQTVLLDALKRYFNKPIHLKINVVTNLQTTPALQTQQKNNEQLEAAKNKLMDDPNVKNMLEAFGGTLDENSIKL